MKLIIKWWWSLNHISKQNFIFWLPQSFRQMLIVNVIAYFSNLFAQVCTLISCNCICMQKSELCHFIKCVKLIICWSHFKWFDAVCSSFFVNSCKHCITAVLLIPALNVNLNLSSSVSSLHLKSELARKLFCRPTSTLRKWTGIWISPCFV